MIENLGAIETPETPVPYHGQPVIGSDSFLRKLPQAGDPKSRLAFDAMVLASDIMTRSYNVLRSVAEVIGTDVDSIDEQKAATAIGACWTIVDQLHITGQLVKALSKRSQSIGPKTQALIEVCSTATLMRNKMDHIAENLNNLSKRSGSVAPLMGSVSYFHAIQDSEHSGASVTLFSGSLIGEQLAKIVNPVDRTFAMPVGLFEFFAYDINLEIEPALDTIREYFDVTSSDVERQFRMAAEEHAKASGLDTETDLLASARGTFGIAAFFGPSPGLSGAAVE